MAAELIPEPKPTWADVFKDKALIITMTIMWQFFALIIIFSQWKSQMVPEAKSIILQTYVVAFSVAWGFWLKAATGDKPPQPGKPELPGAPASPHEASS